MTKNTTDTFTHIENAAHSGAFGDNPRPTPTEAQANAGNYKVGRVKLYGLNIAIERPRHSYRTGIDHKTGKRWTSRLAAHYGYFEKTKGNDGMPVDCFIGFYPQSEHVYIINQYVNGGFDEIKVMLCFPDEATARRAYLDSYDKGWDGLRSLVKASITQFKWWLKNGNMKKPLAPAHLPYDGLETMNKRIYWNESAHPDGTTLDKVLYEIRRADGGENLLLDSVCMRDILEDVDGILVFDALVTPYVKLERKMQVLQKVMGRSVGEVKPLSLQVSDPFKQGGTAQVAVVFELSDGQTVTVFFHNPDVDPRKIQQTDELISWKWLLNKKDITIVVAPEHGDDLNVHDVAIRIMKLAEKNSAAFQRANSKRAEKMQAIEGIKTEIVGLEAELKAVQHELEVAKIEVEDGAVVPTSIKTAFAMLSDRFGLEKKSTSAFAAIGGDIGGNSVFLSGSDQSGGSIYVKINGIDSGIYFAYSSKILAYDIDDLVKKLEELLVDADIALQAPPEPIVEPEPTTQETNEQADLELQKNLPKGTIAGGSADIEDLANKIIDSEIPANEKRAVRYSIVNDDEAEKIKSATGLDVKGYKHTVDSFGIRHAMSQHGDGEKEALRGQVAITASDIARIPDIISTPDTIENAGADANGNDLIRYSKKFDDVVYYVEEVRDGRMELVSKTLWKTRPDVAMPDTPSQQLTPEATGGNLPQDDQNIPQPAENTTEQPGEINPTDEPVESQQQADPQAVANINAASISDAIKKKAIKYLQENPGSHEIPAIGKKSMAAIMQNIKAALLAEIAGLSPLIKHVVGTDTDTLILSAWTGSGGLAFRISADYKGETTTGWNLFFETKDGNAFDSTSTLEELRQWGFALPFDLDVKAFVANVIKPVVDEFLSKRKSVEPVNNPESDDPEAALRALWAEQGVSKERQDELIADVAKKAMHGAKVGPFAIPEFDADIEALLPLVGLPEFNDKIDALIESIDKAGLMPQYESRLLELDRDHANAKVAKARG